MQKLLKYAYTCNLWLCVFCVRFHNIHFWPLDEENWTEHKLFSKHPLDFVVCLLNLCMCSMLNGFCCAWCKSASHRNSPFYTKIRFLNRIKCNRSLRKWRAHVFTIKIQALLWTENDKYTNTMCNSNNDRLTCKIIAMKFPWNSENTK